MFLFAHELAVSQKSTFDNSVTTIDNQMDDRNSDS